MCHRRSSGASLAPPPRRSGRPVDPLVVGIGDGSLLEAYIVDSPEDGDWIMRVAAVSVPAEGQAYVVTAPTDSPVTMTTSISEASVSPGETVGMTAVLHDLYLLSCRIGIRTGKSGR